MLTQALVRTLEQDRGKTWTMWADFCQENEKNLHSRDLNQWTNLFLYIVLTHQYFDFYLHKIHGFGNKVGEDTQNI